MKKRVGLLDRKNRILLRELVVTDFKLRYQGSALGYVWSVLKPLFLFAILYVVFVYVLQMDRGVPHFAVTLLLGVVLWSFFTEATSNGLGSIVNRGDLIRKLNFPKYIIVISGTISSLINLGINLLVVILFALINGVDFTWHVLWMIPLVLELYVFALGIAMLLSALNVKFRDTGYIWEIFLQAAFYATPIIYPLTMVMERSQKAAEILFINPVAQIIQDARYAMISQDASNVRMTDLIHDWRLAIPGFIILLMVTVGVWYFSKKSKALLPAKRWPPAWISRQKRSPEPAASQRVLTCSLLVS